MFSHVVSNERPIAVLVADIVDFKGVNERLSPEVADQVLRRVGATIRASLPFDADVARIGPDVFAVAAFGIDAATVANAAALIDRRLAEVDPSDMMGDIPISVRIGAVVVTRLDSSPDDLLQRAEGASRSEDGRPLGGRGAGTGRWTPVVLTSDGATESKSWSEELEEALEGRQFVAFAQPLMSLRDAQPLRRFELLVRLVMPDGQLVALPRFDQLAQRMGYGPVVDHWMIERALELLTAAPDLELEVNIAPSSLSDIGFVTELAMRIEELGRASKRLLLALTEQSVLDDVTQALRFGDEARALGMRIVLDEYMAAQDGGSYLESLGISPRQAQRQVDPRRGERHERTEDDRRAGEDGPRKRRRGRGAVRH